jgi:hypothetical protein
MYESGLNERRFRLWDPEIEQFPMLVEMRDEGVTEYCVQVAGFTDRRISIDDQEGVALTWSTTDADGFSEAQRRFLSRLRLPLSALVLGMASTQTAVFNVTIIADNRFDRRRQMVVDRTLPNSDFRTMI